MGEIIRQLKTDAKNKAEGIVNKWDEEKVRKELIKILTEKYFEEKFTKGDNE